MDEVSSTRQVNNDVRFGELLQYQLLGVPLIKATFAIALFTAVGAAIMMLLGPSSSAMTYLIIGIGVVLAIPIALYSAYKKNKDRMVDITTTINPEILVSRTNRTSSELRIEWSRVESVTTSSKMIIFKLVPPLAGTICIPFRCFASEAQAKEFLQDSFAYWKAGQSKKHDAGKCLPASAKERGFWQSKRALLLVPLGACILLPLSLNTDVDWAPWLALTLVGGALYAVKNLQTGDGDMILANGEMAKGNHRKALDMALKALKKYPQHANLHCVAAAAYSGLGQMDKCLSHCNEALKIAPDNAFAYGNRSLAFREMCEFENALADSQKALELEPNLAPVIVFRAACQLDLARYEEGLKSCDEALGIEGKSVGAHMMRANLYLRMNRHDQSVSNAEQALEYSLKGTNKYHHSGCYVLLANIHAESLDVTQAVEYLNKALAIDPKDAVTCSTAAHVYCVEGRLEDALAMTQMALAANPSRRVQAAVKSDAALAEYKKGNIDSADRLADESIQLMTRAFSLSVKSLVLLRQNNVETALATVNQALDLDAEHAMSYWVRHLVKSKMGDDAGASADKETAEKLGFKPHFSD